MPLLVEEPGSERASLLWNKADRIIGVRLVYAEGCAAFAMARRLGRITNGEFESALLGLDQLYQQMDMVEVSDGLVRRAGVLAKEYSLRGYDSVHLAAAVTVDDDEAVLVTGDGRLSQAARALGLATAAINNIPGQEERMTQGNSL